ncbi:probable LRR receptor-like serine/threonine-protein kinase At3g47570 [Quercus lobata]|uniref:non-specific serine/threonine protein kinase n=1 Tax=Quercus lobata TaxID=97700 RepID=A0A7N2MQI2_QUELO|nr:probable LRR receptor-like serine/threonine-protein kinase At3g47570 [Quercus lobata]
MKMQAMNLRLLCSIQFQTILLLLVVLLHIKTLSVSGSSIATSTYFGGNETDHQALLAFKRQITRDPENVFSSWNDSFHFCDWEGVTCGRKHRRVTVLHLRSKGLVGSLSPCIGNLSFIREIVLANNTIGGKIPDEVGRLFRLHVLWLSNNSFQGEIPANLSHCSNIKFLALSTNNLRGEIPSFFGNFSSLQVLSAIENVFGGHILDALGQLRSLNLLALSDNKLSGHIPDTLGQLRSLTYLGLHENKLSGLIPPSLYNLSSITDFYLSKNKLSGSLPTNLFLTLPHLQWFLIYENQFTGSLPVSLSNASELQYFQAATNNFTGKISVNFGGLHRLEILLIEDNNLGSEDDDDEMNFFQSLVNCSSLRKINLSGNQLKGTLPNVLGNLSTQLTYFVIADTLLFGEIPIGLGNLVNLRTLWMSDNKFSGTIPDDITGLKKLQRLYLNNNRLSGMLPITLGNLTSINELDLYNNKLQGTIPSSIENCQNLLLLDLSQNNLTGIIPKQLFAVSMLSIRLSLAQNFFLGSLPFEVGNLVHLYKLDLSENKLFGKIPSSLASCTSLEYLYLEGNLFQGEIPTSLSSSRGIEVMDLSRNNFSSQIPNFLEKLSLKNLNLSFNDFQGEVPTKGVFANASAISLIGNSRLCGGISELNLRRCLAKEEKKIKWPFSVKVVISMACVILVITIVSFFLFYWRKNKRNDNSLESSLKQSFLRVSYQMLLKATDGFSLANLIGVGSFGSVYKGILGDDRSIVAIKVLNIQRQGASRSFVSECEALKNIRHRNLVKIITCCSSVDFHGNDFRALVYEFMPNGSLENWLHMDLETNIMQVEIRNLNILQRTNIAIDVACALDYLHNHCPMPVVHCDIKPSNILFDCDMIAHVGDFGLAKFLLRLTDSKESSSIGIRGTIGYTPPEYGLGSEVSTKGDVYSYGILLLEMITGKRPTDSMFEGGLNLHNYASMAVPDGVMEVVDPKLLNNVDEVLGNHNGCLANKIKECLISTVKVGVACSMELPQERWDISKAISELHLVRDIILGARI